MEILTNNPQCNTDHTLLRDFAMGNSIYMAGATNVIRKSLPRDQCQIYQNALPLECLYFFCIDILPPSLGTK